MDTDMQNPSSTLVGLDLAERQCAISKFSTLQESRDDQQEHRLSVV